MYVAIHFPLTKWASLGLTEKWKSINRGPEGFSDCVVLVKKIPVLINPIYADSLLVSKTDLITDIVPGHQTSSLCVLSGWWQEWRWNKHSSHLSCLSNKTYKLHFHELRYQYSNYSTPFEKKKRFISSNSFSSFPVKMVSFSLGIYNFHPSSPIFPCIKSYSRDLVKAIHFNVLRTRFKGGHDPWPIRQNQRAAAQDNVRNVCICLLTFIIKKNEHMSLYWSFLRQNLGTGASAREYRSEA